MVISAAALVLSTSDYEGQDGTETTVDAVTTSWSDAKAVIFDSTSSPATKTYYTSIQGAIDAIIDAVKKYPDTTWKWTIYVKEQTIRDTINIPYQSSSSTSPANSPGFVEITLRGISDTGTEPAKEPEGSEPVTLTKSVFLEGPLFNVNGRLVLDGLNIKLETYSNDTNCAIKFCACFFVCIISRYRNHRSNLFF